MDVAADLAVLGLVINDEGAVVTLESLTKAAKRTGRETRKLSQSMRRLRNRLRGVAAAMSARQLMIYADTWTLINNRVRTVTATTEQAMTVQMRLVGIAKNTRNSVAATGTLYTRLGLNADQLGRSHEDLLTVVESVNAAMLVSGSTGVESAQAMRQLAQALGAGRLQGDEFRTVMEAMPLVARSIADEMGVAVGDLYKLSADGLIDVQTVIDALISDNDELTARAEVMAWTMGQAFEYLRTSVIEFVGIINVAFNVTGTLAKGVKLLADNLRLVVSVMISLAAAVMAYKITFLIVTNATAIRKWMQTALAIRKTADMMKLLGMAGKGAAVVVASMAAMAIGTASYLLLMNQLEEATRKWAEANADLSESLGGDGEPFDEDLYKATLERVNTLREAAQAILLSTKDGVSQERLALTFDSINKRLEAQATLKGDVLAYTLETIDAEEALLAQVIVGQEAMEEYLNIAKERAAIIDRFVKDLQRSMADTFVKIFNDGLKRFSDLTKAIKRMFVQLAAEIASAKFMAQFSKSLETGLGSLMGQPSAERLSELGETQKRLFEENKKLAFGGLEKGQNSTALDQQRVSQVELVATSRKDLAARIGSAIGPALAGIGIGGIAGSTGSSVLGAFGGGLGGAGSGFLQGGVFGAVVGGLAGLTAGLFSAREKQKALQETMDANNELMRANNVQLETLSDAYNAAGKGDAAELAKDLKLLGFIEHLNSFISRFGVGQVRTEDIPRWMMPLLKQIASSQNITIFDDEGELLVGWFQQLRKSVELSIQAITSWGNNLRDIASRQNARNILFPSGNENQPLLDYYQMLMDAAPDLMTSLNLENLNMDNPEGRAALLAGMQQMFRLGDEGFFTDNPALLGMFDSFDALMQVVVKTAEEMDRFGKQLFNVTTDFPRAMDIIFYEQKFGRFGTGTLPGSNNSKQPVKSIVTIQEINVYPATGESGEDFLVGIEHAVAERRARGGDADLGPADKALF